MRALYLRLDSEGGELKDGKVRRVRVVLWNWQGGPPLFLSLNLRKCCVLEGIEITSILFHHHKLHILKNIVF